MREARLLRFVAGGLLFEAGVRGMNPFDGIDVEELFTAVELLGARRRLEVAPFIAAWHPAVELLEREIVAEERGKYQKAVERAQQAGSDWVGMLPYETTREPGQEFRQLADRMVHVLAEILVIEDTQQVEYLSPVLRILDHQKILAIATLNYDDSIETMAEGHGTSLSTGVEDWTPSTGLSFSDSALRLLKLHGSIDWRLRCDVSRSDDTPMPQESIEVVDRRSLRGVRDAYSSWMVYPNSQPGLVFGQGNKVRAEGPFIDLLCQFRNELASADRLTIVGYSFRDPHVNRCISEWMNGGMARTIRIVDPGFNKSRVAYASELRDRCADRLEIWSDSANNALTTLFGEDI